MTFHTVPDLYWFRLFDIDPESSQGRDKAVRCTQCKRLTFNQAGRCDAHYVRPAAVRAAGVKS